jgi:TM2 domain-containing membrane protein YozV
MKKQNTAGWLGILFGMLGIHNLYLGKKGKAFMQLLTTLTASIFLLFDSSATWAWWALGLVLTWSVVEGCMILMAKPNSKWSKCALGGELV